MEILKPSIINIQGRCYRVNPLQRPPGWEEPEENEDDYHVTCSLDEPCDQLDIRETDKGFSLTVEVPNAFFGIIIGKRAETKKKIERETQSQIIIPRAGGKDEDSLVIRSTQQRGIVSAKNRIDLLVETARQRAPFTHFVSIPLNIKAIQDSYLEFKDDVLRECYGDEGLDETIFQKSAKLHLTIGTLALMTRKEVEKAESLLQKCKHEFIDAILEKQPLLVDMRGLEYMNDDPGKVDVLYAQVTPQDGSNKLQLIADSIMEQFVSEGVMQRDYDKVKLHITLINTIFRQEPDAESGRETKKSSDTHRGGGGKIRESFDARRILQKFEDHFFGEYCIDNIHISQRGSYGSDGYYLPAGHISLPTR